MDVIIIGGEPIVRKDINELFHANCNHFAMFSACLYQNRINEIVKVMNMYENKKLSIVPTIHPYAKNYDWNIFWENVEILKSCKNIIIPRLHVLDYKIKELKNDIEKKCKSMKINLVIKGVDYSVASNRISSFKSFDSINIQNRKKFRKL